MRCRRRCRNGGKAAMVGKALRLLPRSNKPRHAGNWPEGDKILRLSCVLKTYFLLLQTRRDLCVPSLIEKSGCEAGVSGDIHRKKALASDGRRCGYNEGQYYGA